MANLINLDEEPAVKAPVSKHAALVKQLHEIRHRDLTGLTKDEALSLAVEATELSMKLMQLAKTKDEKQLHKDNSSRLLTQAETIKQAQTWDPTGNASLLDFRPLNPIRPVALNVPFRANVTSKTQSYAKKPTQQSNTPTSSSHASSHASSRFAALHSPWPRKVLELKSPVQERELTGREQLLLWSASKLPGGPFPPWADNKSRTLDHHSFAREARYVDNTDFNLSVKQREILSAWKRPQIALPPPHMRVDHAAGPPIMQAPGPTDFVQDAATDCSVVASMCAGMARVEKGFSSLLSGILYPYDEKAKTPMISPNGKYIVRLNFNGCFRKVEIDDRLPVTMNDRLLHVIDRNNPRLLWPALLEKAYLKIRGGYDFPGSNSGTDLWILTGWIPEQVLLQHESTNVERTWGRIFQAFNYGDVLITTGSGKMTKSIEGVLGLVSEHDYAVLDLKEDKNGQRKALIKNPWLNGPTWQGRFGASDAQPAADDSDPLDEAHSQQLISLADGSHKRPFERPTLPGSFWMPFQDVLQHFDSLYLNWNPGLWKYRSDTHFEWDLSSSRSPMNSLRSNPQYTLHSNQNGEVWIILSRHFMDHQHPDLNASSTGIAKNADNGLKPQTEEVYVSLYAFKSHGKRVVSMRNALISNPFVDTPQTLMKLNAQVNEPITVVPAEQLLGPHSYNFSLSVFSQHGVSVRKATLRYGDSTHETGRWTEETAGGNAKSDTYTNNPQYALHLPSESPLSIILESANDDLSVNVKLLHGQGKRFEAELKSRDIILDSGEYRRHCVIASTSKVYAENQPQSISDNISESTIPSGNYTLIVSTFGPGQLGDFTLTVESNVNASLNRIARSGAGRVLKRFSDVCFAPGSRRVGSPFAVNRLVTVNFAAKLVDRAPYDKNVDPALANLPPSPVRLSIESGQGPDRVVIAASGNGGFMDATNAGGIKTEDCQLSPPTKKSNRKVAVDPSKQLWLVLERMGSTELALRMEQFHVESYADVPDWDNMGVWRDVTPGIS
ncbi:MAG: hypothetical protein Q9162_003594 [Coniocarpon cinnabarinum]